MSKIGDPVEVMKWRMPEGPFGLVNYVEEWVPGTCVGIEEGEWIEVAYANGTRERLRWERQWSWV